MIFANRSRLAALYTFAAGAVDAVTGPWLVVSPATALSVMGVGRELERDLLFVSFVGAFVGAVGWTYLWALWRWKRRGDVAFLRAVWRVTILFRLAAGAFVLTHLALDNLDLGWASVPATDFLFAGVQVWLLRAGFPAAETKS